MNEQANDIKTKDKELPLITVIVPVYNVEKYLEKCLESIIKQTYKNLEIILVDDGSTDGSSEKCDNCALQDTRINVIHKENGGLSDARNVALNIMSGEYVTFIDSDDYVTNDYVEYLYNLIVIDDSDMSICCFEKTYNQDKELNNKKEKVEILSSRDAIEMYLYQKKLTASAWCKMYKRELFSEIRYPIGYYYEDMAIICELMSISRNIVISNQKKYYYMQRSDSIMGGEFNLKKMQRIEIATQIKKFIDKKYPDLNMAANARCFLAAIQTFREIPQKDEYMQDINNTWLVIKKYRFGIIRNMKTRILHKFIAINTYFGRRWLSLLGKRYVKINLK